MHLPSGDQINASLEFAGACFRTFDCVKLFRAKRFQGGSLFTALFFFGWGVFNMFYYPSLQQTWSFVAAILLTVVNGIWILMAVVYEHRIKVTRSAEGNLMVSILIK